MRPRRRSATCRWRTLAKGGTAPRDLTLHREGDGTLFYATRLTYAPDAATLTAADRGFRIERQYAALTDGKAGAVGDDASRPAIWSA